MVDDNKSELELGRIFQRLNFFLIGTAFLITAFATVVISDAFLIKKDCGVITLANAINAVGYYLAIFFLFTNYWNIKLLNKKNGDKYKQTYSPVSLTIEMLGDFGNLILKPFDVSRGHPAPHTWLLPILFVIFWFVLWLTVLDNLWVVIVGGILIPLTWCIVISLIECSKKKPKRTP